MRDRSVASKAKAIATASVAAVALGAYGGVSRDGRGAELPAEPPTPSAPAITATPAAFPTTSSAAAPSTRVATTTDEPPHAGDPAPTTRPRLRTRSS